jgi:hypothetical protein
MHRTTIRLDEHLLVEVKSFAVDRRMSITAVIEEALRSHMARAKTATLPKSPVKFPTFKGNGYAPGIETWEDVKRVLDDEDIERYKRVTRGDAASGR